MAFFAIEKLLKKKKVVVTATLEDIEKNIFILIVLSYIVNIFEIEISTSKKCAKSQFLFKNIVVEPQTVNVYILPFASYGFTLPENDYNDYYVRFVTYAVINEQHFDINRNVSVINLAKAGFIYEGNSAHGHFNVRCPFCGISRSTQQLGNNVIESHRRESPNCPFLPTFVEEGSYWEGLFTTTPADNDNNNDDIAGLRLKYLTVSADIPLGTLSNTANGGFQNKTNIYVAQESSPGMTTILATSHLVSSSLAPAEPVTARNENSALSTSSGLVSGVSNSSKAPSSLTLPHTVNSSQSNPSESHGVFTGTTPSNTISKSALNSSEHTVKRNTRSPTYADLGIVPERPKKVEYAKKVKRLESFCTWSRSHHLQPNDLAEAGFYYAGYGDCARCFYCGGGLRNWEDGDDVWVEHARWFPKCAYIRQQMGQDFVDTVQELTKTIDHISIAIVRDEMGHASQLDSKDNALKRDPAVKTTLDMGYPLDEIISVAKAIIENGNILSADKILSQLVCKNIRKTTHLCNIKNQDEDEYNTEDKILEKLQILKERNKELRQLNLCKICMDKDVAVVFLPCGHFVSCTDCAAVIKDCPVCRNHVKGIVRAFLG